MSEKFPLNDLLSPMNREERLKVQENWMRITRYLNNLQGQVNLVSGDFDLAETISQIDSAVENANTAINSFAHRGEWTATTQYYKNNTVTVSGSSYRALEDNIDIPVTNTSAWVLEAQKGEQGPQGPQPPLVNSFDSESTTEGVTAAKAKELNDKVTTVTEQLEQTTQELGQKANVSYVNQQVQASNLAYKESYATLSALQAAYPTGNQYNHVVLADGMIYTWSNNTWVNTQIQGNGTGIANNTISKEKLTHDITAGIADIVDLEDYLYAVTDKDGRLSEFVLSLEGKVPADILQAWKERMGLDKVLTEDGEISIEAITNLKIALNVLSTEFEIDSTLNPDIQWGITDKEGRLSELTLNSEGQIPSWVLNAWKARMEVSSQNSGEIVAWGDSLTAWGGYDTSYIAEVGRLSGRTVHNNGVGGEPSNTIAARQGGLVMMVNNITIPASASERVVIATANSLLTDNTGKTVSVLRQGTGGINPCYIKGVKGNLSVSQSSASSNDYTLYFQRETNGNAVVINRSTPIITDGSLKRRNDIMVIFIGQNGGYTDDNELISQIKAMVDFNTATRKEYVVLGLTSSSASHRAPLEKAMTQAFGRRYINLRAYLSTYGMEDLGLTPTQNDLSAMEQGNVPPSMLLDTVHHTDATRQLIGRLVYERMIELGIL